MEGVRKYATPNAFRRALEDRLKQTAVAERRDLQRLMRDVAFDRFLARLFSTEAAPWVLKGGYALELRIKEARVTKDIDLVLRASLGRDRGMSLKKAILEALIAAGDRDLADFFSFQVGEPMRDLDAAPYGGARFPVEARLDGRSFVKFHVDVAAGDAVLSPLDVTEEHGWLQFAGIPPAKFPTLSREQHFAEKVHAYTLPRQRPNSRVRDLVDMILLIGVGTMDAGKVWEALRATFDRRKTHPLPASLERPPESWRGPYSMLAKPCGLSGDLDTAFESLSAYCSSLLGGRA